MRTKMIRPLAGRPAFTLVELIVVLMILIGLAAILIPAVTDMVARTNRSTASSNISEVAGAIQRYDAQYLAYPENLDSLVSSLTAGTALTTLNTTLAAALGDVTLSASTLATLSTAGITSVGVHAATDDTFDMATPTALTSTSHLRGLSAATQVSLGLETTGVLGKYIVLGVGSLNDMNGKTMIDAPVHFPRDAVNNPQIVYSRFLVVIQITDGTTALNRAKVIGVIAPDASALSGELSGYFYIAQNK